MCARIATNEPHVLGFVDMTYRRIETPTTLAQRL